MQMLTNDEARPIHMAASAGHAAAIDVLVESGAEVHVDEKGSVPIQQAAHGGHVKAVAALIEQQADIHVKTGNGFGLVHVGASLPHTDVLEYLVKQHELPVDVEPPEIAPVHIA